ncbi:MAG: Tim44/TimA family putative adaptor protein [Alphaproteobacteria bacterium]
MANGYLDIIFIAMVAVFIVLRLFRVLGRRSGNERRPPTLFGRTGASTEAKKKRANVVQLPERPSAEPAEEATAGAPGEASGQDRVSMALSRIGVADRSFDRERFIAGARAAFETILEAFAAGDKAALRSLLADDVLHEFMGAVRERVANKQVLDSRFVSLEAAEIIDAELSGRLAQVTVKFVSEQINCLRDAEGNLLEGDPEKISRVTDIWTFERDAHSRDPNWRLIETRSPN